MGWGMSSIIKHRKEKTQDRMTYKSHYKKPKEFLLIEHTHTGRVGTKKGRVMALVWRSAASECVPRQVSTLHDGTIMTDIILPSGIFKWWSLLLHCKASWFLCRFCQLWCWLLRKRKPNDTLQHKDSSQIMHWMRLQFSSPITPAYFKKTCSFLMRIQLIWTRVMLTHLKMAL